MLLLSKCLRCKMWLHSARQLLDMSLNTFPLASRPICDVIRVRVQMWRQQVGQSHGGLNSRYLYYIHPALASSIQSLCFHLLTFRLISFYPFKFVILMFHAVFLL